MSLQSLQQWLWSALQQSSAEISALDHIIEVGHLPALDRLGIYARGYRLRLLECLRAEFPVLRALLGDSLFDAFALDYLGAHPSTSYTLNALGLGFPAYLSAQRPDAADDSPKEDWIDFMIDLASLERATGEVYDGLGDEGCESVAYPAVSRSLRLLHFSHPVHECIRAFRQQQALLQPQPKATWLAVTRRDYRVVIEPLNVVEFNFLRRVAQGEAGAVLAEICAGAGEEGGKRWLQRQCERGLLQAMSSLNWCKQPHTVAGLLTEQG